MASAPQNQLPLFYNALEPLSSQTHAKYKVRATDNAPFLVGAHAIPVTVDEFPLLQRHMPIVFTVGEEAIPIALMGLNEGVNAFVDDEGKLLENVYVPAYVRRYPFLLAKLTPDATDLSLCFDPTSDLIGEYEDGAALFDGEQPSESCKAMLDFCQQFEEAGMRTGAFIEELTKHKLLMDGEVAIQIEGQEQPYVYRGFQMINQEALREVRGDVLRGWNQSGLLPLLYAHLFSLELVREVFGRQVQQGKGPVAAPAPAAAEA